MKKTWKLINDNLERWVMMVLFVALFAIVMLGVISRVLRNPFTWTEEAARLCFIWLIFTGLSYGTKYDKHINVTIITDKLPGKLGAAMPVFWDIVSLVVFLWVSFCGVEYILYMAGSLTPVLQINQGITTSIVGISAILNCIRIVEKMVTVHIPALKEA